MSVFLLLALLLHSLKMYGHQVFLFLIITQHLPGAIFIQVEFILKRLQIYFPAINIKKYSSEKVQRNLLSEKIIRGFPRSITIKRRGKKEKTFNTTDVKEFLQVLILHKSETGGEDGSTPGLIVGPFICSRKCLLSETAP